MARSAAATANALASPLVRAAWWAAVALGQGAVSSGGPALGGGRHERCAGGECGSRVPGGDHVEQDPGEVEDVEREEPKGVEVLAAHLAEDLRLGRLRPGRAGEVGAARRHDPAR